MDRYKLKDKNIIVTSYNNKEPNYKEILELLLFFSMLFISAIPVSGLLFFYTNNFIVSYLASLVCLLAFKNFINNY